MLFQYAHVLLGFLFGLAFVAIQVFVLVRLLSPRVEEKFKSTTYECGEPPTGEAWIRFDMRFYTMALIFIIFDVEAVLLFPWAAAFNDLVAATDSLFAYIEMAVFVFILTVGLVYVWKKGDMDWVKSTTNNRTGPSPTVTASSTQDPGRAA